MKRLSKRERHQLRLDTLNDVIEGIESGWFVPRHGIYTDGDLEDTAADDPTLSVDDIVRSFDGCEGCAMGVMLYGYAYATSNVEGNVLNMSSYGICEALAPVFTEEELRDLEAAFEGSPNDWGDFAGVVPPKKHNRNAKPRLLTLLKDWRERESNRRIGR